MQWQVLARATPVQEQSAVPASPLERITGSEIDTGHASAHQPAAARPTAHSYTTREPAGPARLAAAQQLSMRANKYCVKSCVRASVWQECNKY